MKKNLFSLILFAAILSGCGNATETEETIAEETIVTETETVTADTTITTEIDNTTAEIEKASAEVDSLLNEI